MSERKNILALISYPFLPATTGGEISTLQILTYLSHKHNVTVFTVEPYSQSYNTGDARFELIFGMPFKTSRYYNFGLIRKITVLAKTKQAEWFFFDQPWFGWLMMALRIVTGKKIFMRSNNIEYLRFKSMGKWFWQLLYIYEKWTYRTAHLVIFVSETDRQKAIYEFDLKTENTLLTPYGVTYRDVPMKAGNAGINQLRNSLGIKADEKMILFFSTLSYFPNYEAVGFIANEVYPRLKDESSFRFKIVICGKGLPDEYKAMLDDKPEMIYTGFVDDISLYIDAADVMINPLLSGGGVKTKAIDTLARNQRVISTQNGAEGIKPEVCGENLIITTDYDWDAFSEAIIKYCDKPKSIPKDFYSEYGWSGIIEKLSTRL
jgi:hypothetical protein